jgi:hypothetical protein
MVDLTSGVSRVESGKGGQGRVQGLFLPGSAGDLKPGVAITVPAAEVTADGSLETARVNIGRGDFVP